MGALISILILALLTLFGFTHADAQTPAKGKELITQYYSVKLVNGKPAKDKLKDCFSCNQSRVFDRNGRELELRFYKSDLKTMYGFERYLYNPAGLKIGSEYFDEKGVNTTTYKYQYDALDRRKFSKAYDKKTGKMLYGNEFDHDNRGNQFETATLNKNGEITEYYRREYNVYGLPVLENIVNKTGKVTFKVYYEYLPCGTKNWTEQVTYYNGKLSEIRRKEIRSYETSERSDS